MKTVVVRDTIYLPSGTTLDGGGKTVTVPKPYLTAGGAVTDDYSEYCVFKVDSGAAVTIRNMTILGGGRKYLTDDGNSDYIGGIYNNGSLTLENVNVSRCYRGIWNDSSGKLVMKNTNVVNNAAKFGGGIVNNGVLVMDGCSLSANRSIRSGNGGGRRRPRVYGREG